MPEYRVIKVGEMCPIVQGFFKDVEAVKRHMIANAKTGKFCIECERKNLWFPVEDFSFFPS